MLIPAPVFFIGIIEDVDDPQMLGRVRVRAMVWHSADRSVLPTDGLPWAHVMLPTSTASVAGIGTTPHGLLPGSVVLGIFVDGESAQTPMVLGSITGSYTEKPSKEWGFADPSGKYPPEESDDGQSTVDEPDTNRLARAANTQKTLLKRKEDDRDKDVIIALQPNDKWSEPASPYGAQYPHNKVEMTESGHVVEMDDTPGAERIHEWHKSGTFVETAPDGSQTTRIVGQRYEIVHKDGYLHVKGVCTITVDDKAKVYVGGDAQIQVDGNATGYVAGDVKLNIDGNTQIEAEKDISVTAKGKFKVHAHDNIELSTAGGANLTMAGSGRTIFLNSAWNTKYIPPPEEAASAVEEAVAIPSGGDVGIGPQQ